MAVPSDAGLHRVNWDLRHSLPGQSEPWQRYENPDLARPIGNRGPWTSPGTYTVTIDAQGASASTQIEVRGDPEMPITLAMYQSREQYMLDALALTGEIQAFMGEHGMNAGGRGRGGFGRGGAGMPTTPEAKLRAAARMVQQAYGALNGGAVRPGTLYPPTRSQREQVRQAVRLFDDVRREMNQN